MKSKAAFFWLIAYLLTTNACAPVFSELQSARTAGRNRVELTPAYSTVGFSNQGQSTDAQNEYGGQLAYGVSSFFDIRVRYEHISIINGGPGLGGVFKTGADVLAFGPKFAISKNKVAFSLPVGRALGDKYSESWEAHPTLLFSLPAVKDKLDINVAPKFIKQFCSHCDPLFAVNLGMAVSNDLNKWALRVEYGRLYNFEKSGYYSHFSLGLSFTFGENLYAPTPPMNTPYKALPKK